MVIVMGLPSKLWNFSKIIMEKVDTGKENGEFSQTKKFFMKSKIEDFEYNEGGVNFSESYYNILKEEWNLADQFNFVDKVKQLSDYKEIVLEISTAYGVDENKANGWLSEFVSKMTFIILEGISDESLVDNIATFINDIENGSLEWNFKIWINGIWLKNNEYDIYSGLKIRRPMPIDLEIEKPFDISMIDRSDFNKASNAIIELRYRSQEHREYNNEIDNLLNCLRLFKLGSVHSIKTENNPKSFIMPRSFSSSLLYFSTTYKYSIDENEIPKLKDFLEKIKTLLPKSSTSKISEEIDPIIISLQRYNDALLKPESIESRITSAITCFEALYLKGKERMELSHRLSQRASVLLKLFDFTPLEVYRTLIQAYDVRSTYIHGSQIKPEERKNLPRIAEKTLEYARVSILIFLQLKPLIDKEKFIAKIDNSILDEEAYSKLKKLVNENCIV